MTTTKIQWTDETWNPVRGCTEISPGCAHCYAKTFAERWRGVKGHRCGKRLPSAIALDTTFGGQTTSKCAITSRPRLPMGGRVPASSTAASDS